MNAPPPTPDPVQPAPPTRSVWRFGRGVGQGLTWTSLWLPGALLALLLTGLVALWFWADTPGSLARALTWAQTYTEDRASETGVLKVDGVQGSLRAGGRVAQLQWSREGLSVQATDVQLSLGPAAWLGLLRGRSLQVQSLHIGQVRVDDQRPDQPREPLQPITLPLALSLPWSVDEVVVAGERPLSLSGLKGHYRYGPTDPGLALGVPDAHQLTLDTLTLAGGQYRGRVLLGAQHPLPLTLELHGALSADLPGGRTLQLQTHAQASGTLGGLEAALDLSCHVQALPERAALAYEPPTLAATARIQLWAAQPLVSAHAYAHQLDLSVLWPTAPLTLLSGTLSAQPLDGAWQARVDLRNGASGPADRQRVPVQSLQALLEQRGERWTLSEVNAQVGGGHLQGQAQLTLHSPSSTPTPQQPTPAPRSALTGWQGDLQLRGINPALLWSPLAPAALDGSLSASTVTTAEGRDAFELNTRLQPASRQPPAGALARLRLRELRLQGRWQPAPGNDPTLGLLKLQQAQLQMADARLDTQGVLDTAARRFTGQISLQLPGAQLRWSGELAHYSGTGDARVQLDDAQRVLAWVRNLQAAPLLSTPLKGLLDQQPGLAAQGSAALDLQWQGGLGALGYPAPLPATAANPSAAPISTPAAALPRVQLALDVPRLQLQPSLDSAPISLHALSLKASGLLDDLELQAQGSLAQAPWRASLDTQGRVKTGGPTTPLASGQLDLSRLRVQLSQTRPDASSGSPNKSTNLTEWILQSTQPLALRWQGGPPRPGAELRLQMDAGHLQLQALLRNAAGQRVPSAELDGMPLSLEWEQLVWQANALQSKGRLRGLPLAWVEVLGRAEGAGTGPLTQAGISGNLVLDGRWDLLLPGDASAPPRLLVELQRSSGDITVQGDGAATDGTLPSARSGVQVAPVLAGQRLQAGIREAALSINAQGRQVKARLRWNSERLGEASADLSTELNTEAGLRSASGASDNPIDRWWPASAPLRGSARASLPQVGVWSALAPPGWRMRGTLSADATVSGTRGAPQFNGTLQADQLALRSVVDGFAFSNGQLRATLSGERLIIQRFTLQGPRGSEPGGTLEATGTAEWRTVPGSVLRQPFIDLRATATELRVSNRADRRLTLSGQVSAQLAGPRLTIRGQLGVDSALIVLPDENVPTLGSDVVLRGTREPEDPEAVRVQPDVLVDVDLGDRFEVRGRGIQTRLAGQISVRSTPGVSAPRVLGEVRAVNGTYRAYGQQLRIETGVLRFVGPYDNPTLDILAIRPLQGNETQRVGVQITGTAQLPRVRLYSDPELPDSEKLAWLVLGRPATGAGAEAAVLQQAAMALLARNRSGGAEGLASTFGLDELGFRGQASNADGSTTAAALTLGKRLSKDLYVSYERSLAGALGTVSIFYDFSRRLTLRARAGEENAIDLIFTVRYD
jgi:translocation and assembly module TamB